MQTLLRTPFFHMPSSYTLSYSWYDWRAGINGFFVLVLLRRQRAIGHWRYVGLKGRALFETWKREYSGGGEIPFHFVKSSLQVIVPIRKCNPYSGRIANGGHLSRFRWIFCNCPRALEASKRFLDTLSRSSLYWYNLFESNVTPLELKIWPRSYIFLSELLLGNFQI